MGSIEKMPDILTQLCTMTGNNGEIIPMGFSREEMRANILAIQSRMQEAESAGEVVACDIDATFPLRHIFAPGNYAREMTLPAGHWIIGKIHKHAHLNFVSKGHVAVLTEEGAMFIRAPYSFVSSPGTKRLVLVLEETIWTTVHPTEKTDLTEIESDIIAKTYEELGALTWHGA